MAGGSLQQHWNPYAIPGEQPYRYEPKDFPPPPGGGVGLFHRRLGMPRYPIPPGLLDPADEYGYYTFNPETSLLDPSFPVEEEDWDIHHFGNQTEPSVKDFLRAFRDFGTPMEETDQNFQDFMAQLARARSGAQISERELGQILHEAFGADAQGVEREWFGDEIPPLSYYEEPE